MSKGAEHLKDEGSHKQAIIAGAVAGLFSRFCIAPLDVLKIRLQLQVYDHGLHIRPETTISTFRSILRDEGVRAFWKGNVPAELLYVTYSSAQFTTYHYISSLAPLQLLPSAASSFVAGASAGTVATTLTYPLDLLRTRLAAQRSIQVSHARPVKNAHARGPSRYPTFLSSIRSIYHTEGIPGYFLGLGAGIAQIVPYMGLFFAGYETLRSLLAPYHLPFGGGDAIAGVIAATTAKTGVFPLDVVRKRLQVQGPSREGLVDGNLKVPVYGKKGVIAVGREIMRMEGWRALYRGLPVGLIKAAPASATTIWGYEITMGWLKALEEAAE
ncbi:mitochondrial thiamine pyrophosphate transporter [Agyrium rufum]|nr:mitochondrial thiamine pyrophosphate transporter [Agyrium rufum]